MPESFNYIAFGNRDLVKGDVEEVGMSRGRMFEYTPTDVEKRLEELGPSAIGFIEMLPTFLCSEIEGSRSAASMEIKYGQVGGLVVGSKEVTAKFTTLIDFGDVRFSSVDHAKEVLDADGFQLHRTHWAVRSGQVTDILKKLAELKPEVAEQVDQQTPSASAEPPRREKKIIGSANSVESFLKILYKELAGTSTENFFRGHEDATFELTPSLLRKWPNGSWKFLPSEDRLCKELLIAHHEDFQGDQYCFDRLVRMQHYGLPTRLLDVSSNPLVALFFACYGSEMKGDGEVITFNVSSDRIKYYDSDTVSCLANLSNLTYAQKNDIDLTLPLSGFNVTPIAQKLLHHIKSEKGFFEGRIVPDSLGSIVCVKAKRSNARIRSQSGAFLLFGHEAALPEMGQDGITISRITIKRKQQILKQLDSININATTVYPSIDQTAVHLRQQYLKAQSPELLS